MKLRTLRSRHIVPMIVLPLALGACTQNKLASLPDVIANDRPEVIHVQARIPGDYGLALRGERKIFWERTIENPRLVGNTIVGSHNGRLVEIPLEKVTRVRVPEDVDWDLNRPRGDDRVGGFAGELLAGVVVCMFSYGLLC